MPWTAEDMKAKGAKDPAKAAEIANAVLADCRNGGKTEEHCEQMAIVIALANVNRRK